MARDTWANALAYNHDLERAAIPDDPLEFIKSCVRRRQIRWTHHVSMRLRQRPIKMDDVMSAVESFQVIEQYPADKYLPSYLLRAESRSMVFHIHAGADVEGDNIRIVTVYLPMARRQSQ